MIAKQLRGPASSNSGAGPWLAFFGMIVILVIAPSYVSTAYRDGFTTPRLLPLSLGAMLFWFGLLTMGDDFQILRKRSMDLGIAAMALAVGITTIFSIDLPLSILGPHQGQFHSVVPLALLALLFYGSAYLGPKEPDFWIMVGAIPVSVLAVLEMLHRDPTVLQQSMQNGRSASTFGSPVFLGAYLAAVAPLAWHRCREGLWGVVVFVLVGLGLYACASRGGAVGAVCGVVCYELLMRGKSGRALGVMGITQLAILAYPARSNSDIGRAETWKIALKAFAMHPWLGSGPDTFGLMFRRFMTARFVIANHSENFIQVAAHHDILQVAATMGIVGLLAYGLFLYKGWVVMVRESKIDPRRAAMAGALCAVFINAKVNPIHLSVLAICAVLLGALDFTSEKESPSKLMVFVNEWVPGAVMIVLLVIVGIAYTECEAEEHQAFAEIHLAMHNPRGWAQEMNEAAQINRYDFFYTEQQLNSLYAIIPTIPRQDLHGMMTISQLIADRAVRWHPNDPAAHEALATALLYQAAAKGRRQRAHEIEREIQICRELAPSFGPFAVKQAQLAQSLHGRRKS